MDVALKILLLILLSRFATVTKVVANLHTTNSENNPDFRVETCKVKAVHKFAHGLMQTFCGIVCCWIILCSNGGNFNAISTMAERYSEFGTKRHTVVTSITDLIENCLHSDPFPLKKGRLYSDLFRFQQNWQQKIQAFPASLGNYFRERERTTDKSMLMKFEWSRYETFKTFPVDSPVMPIRLAANGFYYDGFGDSVTCFSCKRQYRDWKASDIVAEIHSRLSPNCSFVRGLDSSNIGIHSEILPQGADGGSNAEFKTYGGAATIDAVQIQRQNRVPANNGSLTGLSRPHKYPNYGTYQNRMDTFSGWPYPEIIEPCVLADAGFYFVGYGDCVRCFSCGGGLRNWEYGDGPWSEHARWFPTCRYLTERKGPDFIRHNNPGETGVVDEPNTSMTITDNHHDPTTADVENSIDDEEATESNDYTGNNPKYQVENSTTGKSSAAIYLKETLLEMGFLEEDIENILRQKDFQEIEEITDDALSSLLNDMLSKSETSQEVRDTEHPKPPQSPSEEWQTESTYTSDTGLADQTQSGHIVESSSENTLNPKVLLEENLKMKDRLICKLCMEKDSNIVFTPCGHMIACDVCAPKIRKCAMCRQTIQGRVRTYIG